MSRTARPPGRLLLASLPFADTALPSIQLAALAAYLRRHGHAPVVRHLYLRAMDTLGHDPYVRIAREPKYLDLLYASWLFPDHFAGPAGQQAEQVWDAHWTGDRSGPSWRQVRAGLVAFHTPLLEELVPPDVVGLGLTTNYRQLLPSLWLARELKARRPELFVILGGGEVGGDIGPGVLECFPWIDAIATGEGEAVLLAVADALAAGRAPAPLPGLALQGGPPPEPPTLLDLAELPLVDHADVFAELEGCSEETQLQFHRELYLPVEGSRGCPWGRCTFCALNLQFPGYRVRPAAALAAQVDRLAQLHHRLAFTFTDNTIAPGLLRQLLPRLEAHGRDYHLFAELRARGLTRADFAAMARVGSWELQIGIESFSPTGLRRMDKGATLLDNVAALRLATEFGLSVYYNLLRNFPDELPEEAAELQALLPWLRALPPPQGVGPFYLGHGSRYHADPVGHGVAARRPDDETALAFPPELVGLLGRTRYGFEPQAPIPPWPPALLDELQAWQSRWQPAQPPLLAYRDGHEFLLVRDRRDPTVEYLFEIGAAERRILLACRQPITRSELVRQLAPLAEAFIAQMLGEFQEAGLVLAEQDRWLTLALPEVNRPAAAWPPSTKSEDYS